MRRWTSTQARKAAILRRWTSTYAAKTRHARDAETQAFNNYKCAEKDTEAYFVDLGKIEFATCDGLHPASAGHEQIFKAVLPAFNAIFRQCDHHSPHTNATS